MENLNLEMIEIYLVIAIKVIIKIVLFFTLFLCVAKANPTLGKVWLWSVTYATVAIMYFTLGCAFIGVLWFIIWG